jgi:hypothetical protein
LYSFCSQSYANGEFEYPCMSRFGANIQFSEVYFGPEGTSAATFDNGEHSYGPTWFAGNIYWTTVNYTRWDSFFGSRRPPVSLAHGSLGIYGCTLEAESGCVFLGGLSIGFNVIGLDKDNTFEYTSRKKRIVNVLEISNGFWRGKPCSVFLQSIDLDDAVLKFGSSNSVEPPNVLVSLIDIVGGATVNASASGKKVGLFCRSSAGWVFQLGTQNGSYVPTATGIDGDILLYNFGDWSKTLSYATVARASFTDLAGNLWRIATGNANTGNPRAGTLLTNANVVIAPGTDKCALYTLPQVLTANHQVTIDPTAMLAKQETIIRVRDLSANTYAVIDGGPGGVTLFTKPASPGAVIDVHVQLNAAGTNIELSKVTYEDV